MMVEACWLKFCIDTDDLVVGIVAALGAAPLMVMVADRSGRSLGDGRVRCALGCSGRPPER